MNKLRFAQAGVEALHAPLYRQTLAELADEIELVGVCAGAADDRAAARDRDDPLLAGVPHFDSVGELIERLRPDAVLVTSYLRDMPVLMLEVAEAGIHIWGEKPLATRSGDLLPVAAAVERNRLCFSCGYSWRFHPVTLSIKESVEAGVLGRPYAFNVHFATSSVAVRGRESWLFDSELAGGGILNWLGCHWLDLMGFITGSRAVEVSAIEANVSGDVRGVEDAASVSLRFSNGMLGSLQIGYYTSGDEHTRVELYGSSGSILWDVGKGRYVIRSSHATWEAAPARVFDIPCREVAGYGAEGRALMQAFAAAIRGERPSGYTVPDAVAVLRIVEAAHESARSGRAVAVEQLASKLSISSS